ncbi:hypothetical protein KUTeg_016863, partial [Tegillarca granosa]
MVQVISEQKDLDALIQSGKLELSKLDENKDVIFCKVNVDEAEIEELQDWTPQDLISDSNESIQ